jgi:quinol monooxygenase YgiN
MQVGYAAVVLTARVEARASDRRELVQALLEWAAAATRETGALGVHVYEDLEIASRFCAVSEWMGAEDMEGHVRGAAFGVLMGALDALGPPAAFSIARQEGGNAADTIRGLRRLRGSHQAPAR